MIRLMRIRSLILVSSGLLLLFSAESVFGFQEEGYVGDPVRGGLLYEAWDKLADKSVPEGDHPLWKERKGNEASGTVTWRCVTCHGWDYKGVDGAAAEGTIWYTGFSGVFQVKVLNYSEEEIVSWLDGGNNPNHNFMPYLGEQGVYDLAAFLSQDLIDMEVFINYELKESIGRGADGEILYKDACKACHGNDGAKINFGTFESPVFMGNIGLTNPWRIAHLMRFGHINVDTPTMEELRWTILDVADLLDYLRLLPKTSIPEEEEEVEVIDYSDQGDTSTMVIAAFVISSLVIAGLGWGKIRNFY